MTPLPRSILEAAEKATNEKYPDIDEWDTTSQHCRRALINGAEWLFSHLCALSKKEFDEKDAKKMIKEVAVDQFNKKAYSVSNFDIQIARHQHVLDMAALLKERDAKKRFCKAYDDALKEIVELKTRLGEDPGDY